MIGRSVSHFKILEKLGEGGMGIVYKARDTHLDRFVALKMLSAGARSAEWKQRFVREAKSASALNHPNIVTVHDIGEVDGSLYMVMEFVAGRTLGQVIDGRPLPLDDAIALALQIARALDRAHSAGIIHRDLKPANIMVTSDRLVKILDFGIAKLLPSNVPTIDSGIDTLDVPTTQATEAGTLLGTPAYMSPEQAGGHGIDARSDIFSFGALFYEMITGQRAFTRGSRIYTIIAIIKEEPTPVTEFVRDLPPGVEHLLGQCLRKDPNLRFQSIGEVVVALEGLREGLELESAGPSHAESAKRWPPIVVLPLVALVAVTCAFIVAFIVWKWTRKPPPDSAASGAVRLTQDAGISEFPALSRDGKLLAYASDRSGGGNYDLWVKQVPNGEPMQLTKSPSHDYAPHFSPDSTKIVYRSEQDGGGVYMVSALGGVPRLLAPQCLEPKFSPDGSTVLCWKPVDDRNFGGVIHLIPAIGGGARALRPDYRAVAPCWSPDGKHILFLGGTAEHYARGHPDGWFVAATDGSSVVELDLSKIRKEQGLDLLYPGGWVAGAGGGTVVFAAESSSAQNLWRVSLGGGFQPRGAARRLTAGTEAVEAQPAVSGRSLAYSSHLRRASIWAVAADADAGRATGPPYRLSQDLTEDFSPQISTDGRMLTLYRGGESRGVWVRNLEQGTEVRVAPQGGGGVPLLSPDGTLVAYSGKDKDWEAVYVTAITGNAAPRKVCQDCKYVRSWSSDNRLLLFQSGGPESVVSALNVGSGEKREVLRSKHVGLFSAHFSPDDRWVAFLATSEDRRQQLFVAPFHDGGGLVPRKDWIEITDGKHLDNKPFWSPNGNLLYFSSTRGGHFGIWAQRLHPQTKRPIEKPVEVVNLSSTLLLGDNRVELSVARDKLVYGIEERRGNIWMMTLPE